MTTVPAAEKKIYSTHKVEKAEFIVDAVLVSIQYTPNEMLIR